MSQELMVFNNEGFGSVRSVLLNDDVWFIGKDIVEDLGYDLSGNSYSRYIKQHCNKNDYILYDKNSSVKHTPVLDYKILGQRGGYLINESGLYDLVFESPLPNAKEFRHWVTSEVLPSIRNKGYYMSEKQETEIIQLRQEVQNISNAMINMANSFKSQLQDAMKLVQTATATASEQLLKAKAQYKPSHKRKLEYNKLIKSMTYSDEAVEAVTSLVLRHFNASKWEDVCADDDNEILSLIHDFAKIINDTKGVETAEQIKMVEVYPEPTQDNVINYFEYLFGGDKPIYKAGINKILVPKKAN